MAKQTTVTVDTRKLDNILKHLDGNVAKAVETAAFAVEAQAKQRAPVDTGALRASIYVSMRGRSRGPERYSDVVYNELPVPESATVAHVGPSVEYGAGVELGTSRRAGTPYLQPAVRGVERDFAKLLGKAVSDE